MIEIIDTDDGGHAYILDGKRVPGVSDILDLAGLVDYGMVSEERLEIARNRGREVHKACEDLDRGINDWWSEDPELGGYVEGYKLFKKEFQFQPVEVEQPHYHGIHNYAGQPDRRGHCLRRSVTVKAIVDLKAVCRVQPCTMVQLAAYALFYPDFEQLNRMAVRLKPDGRYELVEPEDSMTHDLQLFFSALNVARWRDKHFKLRRIS